MGVGLGSDIDTGVGASHTSENVRVTLLSSSVQIEKLDEVHVRCMSARRTSLFEESGGS